MGIYGKEDCAPSLQGLKRTRLGVTSALTGWLSGKTDTLLTLIANYGREREKRLLTQTLSLPALKGRISRAALMNEQDSTHFGYQTVPKAEKAQKVAEVFHSVASSYDLMNDLMSLGIHRLWKRYTVEMAGVRSGQKILDLAGGTGDLALAFSRKIGQEGSVVLADINASMLAMGRNKLLDRGACSNIEFVQANAECLPFASNTFDLVTIAFGLRNVTDKDAALRSMYDVLKPGGRLLVLEFSKPVSSPLARIYDAYSFSILPALGELIAHDAGSYRYLAESIRMHPNQDTLRQMMQKAGFERTDYHNLTGGIVALHRGFKS